MSATSNKNKLPPELESHVLGDKYDYVNFDAESGELTRAEWTLAE